VTFGHVGRRHQSISRIRGEFAAIHERAKKTMCSGASGVSSAQQSYQAQAAATGGRQQNAPPSASDTGQAIAAAGQGKALGRGAQFDAVG
jgi:hypothetical protein